MPQNSSSVLSSKIAGAFAAFAEPSPRAHQNCSSREIQTVNSQALLALETIKLQMQELQNSSRSKSPRTPSISPKEQSTRAPSRSSSSPASPHTSPRRSSNSSSSPNSPARAISSSPENSVTHRRHSAAAVDTSHARSSTSSPAKTQRRHSFSSFLGLSKLFNEGSATLDANTARLFYPRYIPTPPSPGAPDFKQRQKDYNDYIKMTKASKRYSPQTGTSTALNLFNTVQQLSKIPAYRKFFG